MKKVYLLFMMLSLFSILFASCKETEEDPKNEIKEITLAVTGGSSNEITVGGADVIKDIVIKATGIVDRDIEINLVTNMTDGSAVLSASKAVIAKGMDNTTVKITFPALKFPEETTGKTIKVTANTNADKVILSPNFTTFSVKGEGGKPTPAILTATTGSLEVNTTDVAGVAVIDFTLSKALDSDLTIEGAYGEATDFIGTDGVVWNPSPVKITKGTTSLKLSITVPKGRIGSMPITFSTTNTDVTLDIPKIIFTFVATVNPKPEASITTAGALAVKIDGSDVIRTLDIKLNKAADKVVTVNLAATSNNSLNGTLSASSVTFNVGDLAKTVDITFANIDFEQNTSAKVTVTLTSSDVDVKVSASKILFNVAGPIVVVKQDGQVEYAFYRDDDDEYTELDGTIIFTETEIVQGYIKIAVFGEITNSAMSSFNPNVSFDYEVSGGLSKEDIVLYEDFTIIYKEDNYGYGYIKLMKSAIGKSGKLIFTSDGTTFAPDQSWNIIVR